MARFGDLVSRVNTKEDRFNTDKVYYVGGEHIESNELSIHAKGIIEGSTIGPMFYFGFKASDILFVTRNPHLRKAAMVEFDGICSEKTLVLATNDNSILLQNYLAIVMQSDDFWEYCEDNKSGGVNYFINWSTLEEYEFDLPPIDEQKKIASQVWAAYRLKEAYKRLLAATDEMVKSQFIEWFGDVEYIPLKNVCLRIGEYGSNTPATDYDGSVRYLRITDINDDGSLGNEIVSPSTIEEKYYLQTNDFVFARTGNTVGKTYLHTSGKMIYAGYLIRYKLDETCVLPKFLLAYTHTSLFWDWVSKMKKVGAQPNISAQQYNELPIPRAEIASQQRFVSIAEQADKSKFELKRAIEAVDKVIKSLING